MINTTCGLTSGTTSTGAPSGTTRSVTAGRIAPHTAGRIAGLTAGNTAGNWSYEWQSLGVRSLPHAERGYRCYRYCYRRYTCWGGWWWRRCGWRTYCYTLLLVLLGLGYRRELRRVTPRCSDARCVFGWLTASATSRRTNRDISRPTDTITRRVMVIPPRVYITVAGQLQAVTVTVARIGRPGQQPVEHQPDLWRSRWSSDGRYSGRDVRTHTQLRRRS